jgi:integrase
LLQERLLAGARWREHNPVFPSTVGTPLAPSNVTHRIRAQLVRAGLPRWRFQDLRHTAASLLLAQGVHPRVVMEVLVMEVLGHSPDYP